MTLQEYQQLYNALVADADWLAEKVKGDKEAERRLDNLKESLMYLTGYFEFEHKEMEQLAKQLNELTPEQKQELADTYNLAVLPIRIKPETGGGCSQSGCPKGYYCDAQSGNCILNVG